MDKKTRIELARKAIYVLKSMYDERRSCWKIMKSNYTGGWIRFGANWYTSKESCDDKIDLIVARSEGRYFRDDKWTDDNQNQNI